MFTLFRSCIAAVVCVSLIACQSTPEVQQLKDENTLLKAEIKKTRQEIANVRSEHKIMAADNTELKRVMSILDTEKANRTEESAVLRAQTRRFTQATIDQLKKFLVHSNLLDYVGEELFERTKMDIEPAVLVDMANPIPRSGTLVGVHGYFAQATRFSVYVLRPVGERLVVIWQSPEIRAENIGSERIKFPVGVGIEKDDIIAYDFPESIGIKYDQGTGNTLMAKKALILGASFATSSLRGQEEQRAYSIGVTAILE